MTADLQKIISAPRILTLRPFGTNAGFDLQRVIVMFRNSFHDRPIIPIPVASLCVDSGASFQSNVLDLTSCRKSATDIGVDDEIAYLRDIPVHDGNPRSK